MKILILIAVIALIACTEKKYKITCVDNLYIPKISEYQANKCLAIYSVKDEKDFTYCDILKDKYSLINVDKCKISDGSSLSLRIDRIGRPPSYYKYKKDSVETEEILEFIRKHSR